MVKRTIKYYCDICNNEFNKKQLKSENMMFITDCEWDEGRPTSPHIERINIDICNDCLLKSIVLHCGFRGEGKEIRR